MTNREWLFTLSDDMLADWLSCAQESFKLQDNTYVPVQPSPKLYTLLKCSTLSGLYIRQWLSEERLAPKEQDNASSST